MRPVRQKGKRPYGTFVAKLSFLETTGTPFLSGRSKCDDKLGRRDTIAELPDGAGDSFKSMADDLRWRCSSVGSAGERVRKEVDENPGPTSLSFRVPPQMELT